MARPPNRSRIESMIRWYEVARAEFGRPIHWESALDLMKEERAFPVSAHEPVPVSHQIKVMALAQRHYARLGQVECDRFVLPDIDAWLQAIAQDIGGSAALSSADKQALRAFAERVELRMLLPEGSSGKRDVTMCVYSVAASLFNAQLLRDHALGLRKDEKEVTAAAIQRVVRRHRSSV